MPTYYFDTSAIVKHYHQEAGAEDVHRTITDPTADCIVSRLTLTEMQRAFTRRARTQTITSDELITLRRVLYQDLQERRLRIERMHEYHHHTAVRLFLKYWQQSGVPLLRTADALHLSVALRLRDRNSLDHFVCADGNLCDIAEADHLHVVRPGEGKQET